VGFGGDQADGAPPEDIGAGLGKEIGPGTERFEVEEFRFDAFVEGFDIGLMVFLAHRDVAMMRSDGGQKAATIDLAEMVGIAHKHRARFHVAAGILVARQIAVPPQLLDGVGNVAEVLGVDL